MLGRPQQELYPKRSADSPRPTAPIRKEGYLCKHHTSFALQGQMTSKNADFTRRKAGFAQFYEQICRKQKKPSATPNLNSSVPCLPPDSPGLQGPIKTTDCSLCYSDASYFRSKILSCTADKKRTWGRRGRRGRPGVSSHSSCLHCGDIRPPWGPLTQLNGTGTHTPTPSAALCPR